MASRYQPPPIIKACERLLVDIEQAVRRSTCFIATRPKARRLLESGQGAFHGF